MNWSERGIDRISGCKIFVCGALAVLLADESTPEFKATKRWHLSISHPMRYPKWNEIKDARYSLVPDHVTMAMLLPPREEFVNIHPNCFHLHETRDMEGVIA